MIDDDISFFSYMLSIDANLPGYFWREHLKNKGIHGYGGGERGERVNNTYLGGI